ncbi:hypothetical protein ACVILJ_008750 [Bradyrhizobium diazoefficiens]
MQPGRRPSRLALRYIAGRAPQGDGDKLVLATSRISQSQTHLRILAACFARALLHRDTLRCQRAQGRPGAGRAPTVHCAKGGYEKSAQRHTGEAQHTAFPAQWFDGLCRVLPGERCTIAPVAVRIADVRARSGRRITARLDAQTPGARTTRFCRTQITPVVCATAFAHGCPPCDAHRADVTSVHRSSPRMS